MSARQLAAGLLAVAAVVLGLLGGVSVYVRDQIVDERAFAQRAVAALDRDEVHDAIVGEVTAQVRERVPGGVASDAQLQRIVGRVVDSRSFRRAFRLRALDADRVLFERGDASAATLRLGDVMPAFDAVAPRLGALLDPSATARLLTLRGDSLGISMPRIADAADTLARVAPPLAALALLGSLLLASSRRGVLRILGAGALIAGALVLAGLSVGRSFALDAAEAGSGITVAQTRDAIGAAWDAYAGDLRPWAFGALAAGLLLTLLALLPVRRRDGEGASLRPPRRLHYP